MFNHKEILTFGFICLLLGLFTGLAFGNFKKKKYDIYDYELTKLEQNEVTHNANHAELTKLIDEQIKTKIDSMKTRQVWHNCHDKSATGVKFTGITWTKAPKVVIGQTKMTFTNVEVGDMYKAETSVKIADDKTSYDVTLPANDVTKVCVIFIPDEAG